MHYGNRDGSIDIQVVVATAMAIVMTVGTGYGVGSSPLPIFPNFPLCPLFWDLNGGIILWNLVEMISLMSKPSPLNFNKKLKSKVREIKFWYTYSLLSVKILDDHFTDFYIKYFDGIL